MASGVERKHLGYARVSSHDQKEDPLRQAERPKQAGCSEVITDIGSGLNCNKPGLKSLLNRILKGHVHTLSVVYGSAAAFRNCLDSADVPQNRY